MTHLPPFEREMRRLGWPMVRKYNRLSPEYQAEARQRFARHLRACHKTGMTEADPGFLRELVEDLRTGREI